MGSISAFEAKTRFGKLLDRVAKGEEVVITKHDKPVARLIPEGNKNREAVQTVIDRMRQVRDGIAARNEGKPKITGAEIKSWINEGRR